MSRRPKHHIEGIAENLIRWCENRGMDFHQYSPYHMRIMDGGYTVFDAWTTGRYYVLTTDYAGMGLGYTVVERGGEKGSMPASPRDYEKFLDKLFFPPPEEALNI